MTCGGGVRLRSRQCDNPAPLRGGVDCIGSAQEAGDCNAVECIGKSYMVCSDLIWCVPL